MQVVISLRPLRVHEPRAALDRVIDGVTDEQQYVLVDQPVEDVLGFTPAFDQADRVQHLQQQYLPFRLRTEGDPPCPPNSHKVCHPYGAIL